GRGGKVDRRRGGAGAVGLAPHGAAGEPAHPVQPPGAGGQGGPAPTLRQALPGLRNACQPLRGPKRSEASAGVDLLAAPGGLVMIGEATKDRAKPERAPNPADRPLPQTPRPPPPRPASGRPRRAPPSRPPCRRPTPPACRASA